MKGGGKYVSGFSVRKLGLNTCVLPSPWEAKRGKQFFLKFVFARISHTRGNDKKK